MPKLEPKTEQNAEDRYNTLGFTPMNKPTGEPPKIPTNMSDLKDKQLGNLMSRYSAWREYAEDMHTRSVYEYTLANEEYSLAFDRKLLATDAKNVTTAKAYVAVDPTVVKMRKKTIEAEMYMKMVGAKLESFTNVINTLSREITRRGNFSERGY